MLGIILAGGQSQRFGGANAIPKPLVRVSGAPLVLHAAGKLIDAGATRIVVLTGTTHDLIRSGLQIQADSGILVVGDKHAAFQIRFSGKDAGTAGRLAALDADEIGDEALLSYTDVFTDAELERLLRSRRASGSALTLLTAPARHPWGVVTTQGEQVVAFSEKPVDPVLRINAGFFAIGKAILDHLHDASEMLESGPVQRMITAGQVSAVHHPGRWVSVDSPKDLPALVASGLIRADRVPRLMGT